MNSRICDVLDIASKWVFRELADHTAADHKRRGPRCQCFAVHGFQRDANEILALGFPVASFGSYAQDQGPRGKVLDWRVPIEAGGVRIKPGDVIYADRDGVLVVPADVVEAAFAGAIEKVRGEQKVLTALQNGMGSAEAFRLFGVM